MLNVFTRQGINIHYIHFLTFMVMKDIRLRYRKTLLGYSWMLLAPLLQMLVVGFIFSYFIKIPDYFSFLFINLLLWNFVSQSLAKSTVCIVHERVLLQKAKFPVEILPISSVIAGFYQLVISFAIFLPIMALVKGLPGINPAFFVAALVWLLVIIVGLSLLLSALYVRFRDVNYLLQAFIQLWFYATPVLYSLELIPPHIQPIFALNPLTSVFELFQYSLFKSALPAPQVIISNVVISILILIFGVLIFRREKAWFADSL